MEPDLWRVLETLAPTLVYQRSSMIYWQGDSADRLYYLKKGKIRIFLASPDGAERTLRVQQTGGVFGEAAFFDGRPPHEFGPGTGKVGNRGGIPPRATGFPPEGTGLGLAMMRALSARVRLLSSQVDSMAFCRLTASGSVSGRIGPCRTGFA